MDAEEREALIARWGEALREYAEFLRQQQSQNAEMAATLTVLELPNLFALLEQVQRTGDAEATIDLATSLFSLLQNVGKPRLLERVAQVRDAAAAMLGETWNHAQFEAQRIRIEQHLDGGCLREALEGAQQLLQRAWALGEKAYPGADYDLSGACWLLARVWKTAGGSEQALPLLEEAQKRFEAAAQGRTGKAAEGMASVCFAERGECLHRLGRLDEAAAAYNESIRRAEQLGNDRQVAVGKGNLGAVRKDQGHYQEALEAYEESRERFTRLDEPGSVAVSWHQTGMVHQAARQLEAAEDAYLKSLAIEVRLGNVTGQAGTLNQLGILYNDLLGRPEEAAAFYRQAADKYADIKDVVNEGKSRSNLAATLRKVRRFSEARQEIVRAIECLRSLGHVGEPWRLLSVLAEIETDAGNLPAAAEAKRKVIECYLAYRRAGGENHSGAGRLVFDVTKELRAGDSARAASLLHDKAATYEAAGFGTFIQALQAIVAGSRDRTLADAPDLDYTMAAEILFLIETLEKPR
jgi:tetratricopeptide (TPR) repeat protein